MHTIPDNAAMRQMLGLTSTIPVEVVLAAGLTPVDLNNAFIASAGAEDLVLEAEARGFPRSSCAWIKGIYGAVHALGVRRVVAVGEGDCSAGLALLEILASEGAETLTFGYPRSRNRAALAREIERFAGRLGTSLAEAERVRAGLAPLRRALAEVDRLLHETGQVTGEEAHAVLVSSSDFRGDPVAFERELDGLLAAARARAPREPRFRLALLGVPPIATDLFARLARLDVEVVYAESAREFAALEPAGALADAYLAYSYPYDTFFRIERIARECASRRVDGAIHYVQCFCHRALQDRLLRERLGLPTLTLECDRPGPLDAAAVTRVESFLDVLESRRARASTRREEARA